MHENLHDPKMRGEMVSESVTSLLGRRSLIFTGDSSKLFLELRVTFDDKFPKHFLFANFQCLRCGQCYNQRALAFLCSRYSLSSDSTDSMERVQ